MLMREHFVLYCYIRMQNSIGACTAHPPVLRMV